MKDLDNLKNIINHQKEILIQLEKEYLRIQDSDLIKENNDIKIEIEKIKEEILLTKEKLTLMTEENKGLKNALYSQVYNEKLNILKKSSNKLDIYFKANYEEETNRLVRLEQAVKQRIDTMTNILEANNIDTKDEVYTKMNDLSALINEKVTIAKAEANKNSGVFSENEKNEFETLKNEQITDNMIKESAKKNNFESFIGLNLINKLGIFLIIIGVILASKYSFFRLSDMIKAIIMFSLGASMLAVGEILNKKKANIFSLGITAGGVAILYISIATSYFGFGILSVYPAIILCFLITLVAFILATRYNAQVILSFALVGGYLPIFYIAQQEIIIYMAMAYFIVLNLLAFTTSFKKKWILTSYIGLILNIISSIYISVVLPKGLQISSIIGIVYILFAFSVYTLIPIISTYKQKLKFRKTDAVLLAINVIFSSFIIYMDFYKFGLEDFAGILAILFAIIYMLIGRFIESKFDSEKNMINLFYLTGFTFVVLIIPFQFGKAWLSLGWLIQGVSLAVYGILKSEKGFKKIGLVIFGLSFGAFLMVDLLGVFFFILIGSSTYLFAYKYFAITLGSLIILGSFIYKKTLSTLPQKTYKYITIINLWIYLLYFIEFKLIDFIGVDKGINLNYTYLITAFAIVITFLIGYITPRISILRDTGIKIISIVLYIIGIIRLISLNMFTSPVYNFIEVTLPYKIIGTIILLMISLLSVFILYDLMKCIVMEKKAGVEWFPLVVSGYFIFILTQNLITQYNLEFSNVIISIIYVVTALSWIVIGFMKRYAFLRRFGLGLAILSVTKLFLLDLGNLANSYKIISYFVLGITLVIISFVYQYFNKLLELKVEVIEIDKENKENS